MADFELLHLVADVGDEGNIEAERDEGEDRREERHKGGYQGHGHMRREGEEERDECGRGGCARSRGEETASRAMGGHGPTGWTTRPWVQEDLMVLSVLVAVLVMAVE